MQQNGKISASSYSSYIKFVGKSLNPVKALEIYNSIQDESTKRNVFICNSVLSSLVRTGKFDSSIKLFHQMKQDGLTPDVVTYSTVCPLSQCLNLACGKSGNSIVGQINSILLRCQMYIKLYILNLNPNTLYFTVPLMYFNPWEQNWTLHIHLKS